MTITWKSLAAPDLEKSSRMMGQGMDSIKGAAETFDKTITNIRDTASANRKVDANINTENELSRIAAMQTTDEVDAAVDSGEFNAQALRERFGAAMIDTGSITEALAARPKSILDEAFERATRESSHQARLQNQEIADSKTRIEYERQIANESRLELILEMDAKKAELDRQLQENLITAADHAAALAALDNEKAILDATMARDGSVVAIKDEPHKINALNAAHAGDFAGAREAANKMYDRAKVLEEINRLEKEAQTKAEMMAKGDTEKYTGNAGLIYKTSVQEGLKNNVANLRQAVLDNELSGLVRIEDNGKLTLLGDLANRPRSIEQAKREAMALAGDNDAVNLRSVAIAVEKAKADLDAYESLKFSTFKVLQGSMSPVKTLSDALEELQRDSLELGLSDTQYNLARQAIIDADAQLFSTQLNQEDRVSFNNKLESMFSTQESLQQQYLAEYERVLAENPVAEVPTFESDIAEYNELLADLRDMTWSTSSKQSLVSKLLPLGNKNESGNIETAKLRAHIADQVTKGVDIDGVKGITPSPYHIELATRAFLKDGMSGGKFSRRDGNNFNKKLKDIMSIDPTGERMEARRIAEANYNSNLANLQSTAARDIEALQEEYATKSGVISRQSLNSFFEYKPNFNAR